MKAVFSAQNNTLNTGEYKIIFHDAQKNESWLCLTSPYDSDDVHLRKTTLIAIENNIKYKFGNKCQILSISKSAYCHFQSESDKKPDKYVQKNIKILSIIINLFFSILDGLYAYNTNKNTEVYNYLILKRLKESNRSYFSELSTASIAEISAGVFAGLIIIAVALFTYFRKKKRLVMNTLESRSSVSTNDLNNEIFFINSSTGHVEIRESHPDECQMAEHRRSC